MDEFGDEILKIITSTTGVAMSGALVSMCICHLLSVGVARVTQATQKTATQTKGLIPDLNLREKDAVPSFVETVIEKAVVEVYVETVALETVEQNKKESVSKKITRCTKEPEAEVTQDLSGVTKLQMPQSEVLTTRHHCMPAICLAFDKSCEEKDEIEAFVEATVEQAVVDVFVEMVLLQAVELIQHERIKMEVNNEESEDERSISELCRGQEIEYTHDLAKFDTGKTNSIMQPECFSFPDFKGVTGKKYVSFLFEGVKIKTFQFSSVTASAGHLSKEDRLQDHMKEVIPSYIPKPESEADKFETSQREGF